MVLNPDWKPSCLKRVFICSWRGHVYGWIPAIVKNPYAISSKMWGCERCHTPADMRCLDGPSPS